ncbi:hypothetical protein ACLKA7_014924 [Drosophila subpalustris]
MATPLCSQRQLVYAIKSVNTFCFIFFFFCSSSSSRISNIFSSPTDVPSRGRGRAIETSFLGQQQGRGEEGTESGTGRLKSAPKPKPELKPEPDPAKRCQRCCPRGRHFARVKFNATERVRSRGVRAYGRHAHFHDSRNRFAEI